MCDPVSIGLATAAIGVGQSVASYVGQQQEYAVNKQVANLNYANEYNIDQQKRVQLDEGKSEDAVDTAIATVKAQGSVAASAASMGLSSSSIVGALNADMFGIGRQAESEDINDQNQRIQLANEEYGSQIERASKISSVSKPGLINLGLAVGASALKGISAYTTAGGTAFSGH